MPLPIFRPKELLLAIFRSKEMFPAIFCLKWCS
jgi:hypothetical protein